MIPLIKEQYSTALHGITYDPMSTRKIRPILTILATKISRNALVREWAKNTSDGLPSVTEGELAWFKSRHHDSSHLSTALLNL